MTEHDSRCFRPVYGVAYRSVEGRVVIVHPRENRLLTLNETASEVWNRLDGTHCVQEIIRELEELFDTSQDRLSEDVTSFLEIMEERCLIERCGVEEPDR
ncbi:MAG: PqqD family protein [bacterium]